MLSETPIHQFASLTTSEIIVDKVGWRGEGLVRLSDGWVVVPGALPGERVTVEVHPTHPRSHRIEASVLEILDPSPERHPTACHQFPACRGCHLRHVSRDWELSFKQRSVSEILAKFAGWHLPAHDVGILGTAPIHAYRNRGRLAVTDGRIGLFSPGGLQPMRDCDALTPKARQLVAAVESTGLLQSGHLAFLVPNDGPPRLAFDASDATHRQLESALAEHFPQLRCHSESRPQPQDLTTVQAGNKQVQASLHVWTHGSEQASAPLYDWLSDWFKGFAPTDVLELGCGIGSVALQACDAGHRVTGIDGDTHAIELAQHNCPEATFKAAAFERGVRDLAIAEAQFDIAIINPMREPVGLRTLQMLETLGIKHLLYLAPSPQSAAQDLGELRLRGWTLSQANVVDLHPRTYHAMMVAHAVR